MLYNLGVGVCGAATPSLARGTAASDLYISFGAWLQPVDPNLCLSTGSLPRAAAGLPLTPTPVLYAARVTASFMRRQAV